MLHSRHAVRRLVERLVVAVDVLAYVSSSGVPTMRPRNFSGVGTVSEAGR
jgi:hypothetical protein